MDLDALLTHTADGVCAIGVDGRIVFWNRSAERLLGYAGREASESAAVTSSSAATQPAIAMCADIVDEKTSNRRVSIPAVRRLRRTRSNGNRRGER